MIPVEVTQTPWHFTTVSDALDHWQTALAGFAALLAAFIAVVVPEWRARKALRASLAGEWARRSRRLKMLLLTGLLQRTLPLTCSRLTPGCGSPMNKPPLTDEAGKVRALTMDDIRRMKPIAEIDPGMIDTAGRADEGRAAEQAIAGRKRQP